MTRGASMLYVAVPAPVEVVTGRLVAIEEGPGTVSMEDDAGAPRTVPRPRSFRPTPDQLTRLRALQVTERLLHEQLDALLAEMDPI